MLSKTKVDGKSTLETRSWLMMIFYYLDNECHDDVNYYPDNDELLSMYKGQLIIQWRWWWLHTMHMARSLRFFIISFASFIRLVEGGGRRGGLLNKNMFVFLFQSSSLWSQARLFYHCYLHLFRLFSLRQNTVFIIFIIIFIFQGKTFWS